MSELSRQVCEGRPVFFLHIPKTAGSSLRRLLVNHSPAGGEHILSPTGKREKDQPGLLDNVRLAVGHADYALVDAFPRRPVVLTMLRDPVDRALSHYYCCRQLHPTHLAEDGIYAEYVRTLELSPAEFIRERPWAARVIIGNVQTAMLSQYALLHTEHEHAESGRAALETAKRNLAACEFVGLVERLPESMVLLGRTLGWPVMEELPVVNRTASRPACNALDGPTRTLLEEWTALDRELYEFGRDLFEQRLRTAGSRQCAADSPSPAIPLPESVRLTFDQPIPGSGWIERERSEKGWYCWLEKTAWLEFRLAPTQALSLKFLALLVHPRQRKQVEVEVNGELLALRSRFTPDGVAYQANVPLSLVRQSDGVLRIIFRARGPLRPCDVIPGSSDDRLLGLAVSKVELTPQPADSPRWRSCLSLSRR